MWKRCRSVSHPDPAGFCSLPLLWGWTWSPGSTPAPITSSSSWGDRWELRSDPGADACGCSQWIPPWPSEGNILVPSGVLWSQGCDKDMRGKCMLHHCISGLSTNTSDLHSYKSPPLNAMFFLQSSTSILAGLTHGQLPPPLPPAELRRAQHNA